MEEVIIRLDGMTVFVDVPNQCVTLVNRRLGQDINQRSVTLTLIEFEETLRKVREMKLNPR